MNCVNFVNLANLFFCPKIRTSRIVLAVWGSNKHFKVCVARGICKSVHSVQYGRVIRICIWLDKVCILQFFFVYI